MHSETTELYFAFTSELIEKFQDSALIIIVILIIAFLAQHFGGTIVSRLVRKFIESSPNETAVAEKQREDTLINIIQGLLGFIVWPVAGLMIMSELGFDIAPLIAGVGVAGFALGFGAQSLVKDMISGLFIISENQFRVGDVVEIADKTGTVERISLRKTTLRDLDGIVHHVPNGSIEVASNFSMEYSGINFNIGVGYGSDLDKVIEVINRVGTELTKDSEWKDKIIEAPSFLRVDNFADSAIEMKVSGKVTPLTQWEISGEMRKRLKAAFEEEKIEIPFPHRVIYNAN